MRNRFDKQLEQLNSELIEMGNMVENAIAKASSALVKKDCAQAQRVISYENEIDQKEKEIEHLCLKLLLQQQPVAKDLRLISSALKMITDMERIGDQAADISEISIYLANQETSLHMEEVEQMAEETMKMVTNSIEAFVKKEVQLARKVIKQDDIVDKLFDAIKAGLITIIRKDSKLSEQATDMLMIAKYFERIGDHAANIAEWVIFSINGKHEHA